MTHPSEPPPWQRRRRRRQRTTLAVFVLLVLGAGLVAAALYFGLIGASPSSTDGVAPRPCATATPLPLVPRRVKVNVYNTTGRDGLAASTAAQLRARGFVIGEVDNDPARAKVKGTALIRHGRKGSGAAQLIAAQVPGAKLAGDKRSVPVVDLVLGTAFKALGPVPSPVATTPAAPPCASRTAGSPTSVTRTVVSKTRPTTTPR